jgi:hypothetical protein
VNDSGVRLPAKTAPCRLGERSSVYEETATRPYTSHFLKKLFGVSLFFSATGLNGYMFFNDALRVCLRHYA